MHCMDNKNALSDQIKSGFLAHVFFLFRVAAYYILNCAVHGSLKAIMYISCIATKYEAYYVFFCGGLNGHVIWEA